MSNIVNRIIKRAKRRPDPLYNSLIGSIITTVCILTKHSREDARVLFYQMLKNASNLPCNTPREITEYVYNELGHPDMPYKEKIVLITDDTNVRSPMASFVVEDRLMPIRKAGFTEINLLTLAAQGRDWISIESMFEEEDEQ